jgi:deoxyribodipyrimidine photo-lyase
MTNGAFQPASLAMHATPPECAANPPAQPLRDAQPWQTGKPTLLVLTPDDLSLETVAPQTLNVAAVVAPSELFATHAHREAAKDAMERAMQHWRCPVIGFVPIAALEDHSRKFAVRQWVMPYAPVGSPAHIMTAFAQEANYPGRITPRVGRPYLAFLQPWIFCSEIEDGQPFSALLPDL